MLCGVVLLVLCGSILWCALWGMCVFCVVGGLKRLNVYVLCCCGLVSVCFGLAGLVRCVVCVVFWYCCGNVLLVVLYWDGCLGVWVA